VTPRRTKTKVVGLRSHHFTTVDSPTVQVRFATMKRLSERDEARTASTPKRIYNPAGGDAGETVVGEHVSRFREARDQLRACLLCEGSRRGLNSVLGLGCSSMVGPSPDSRGHPETSFRTARSRSSPSPTRRGATASWRIDQPASDRIEVVAATEAEVSRSPRLKSFHLAGRAPRPAAALQHRTGGFGTAAPKERRARDWAGGRQACQPLAVVLPETGLSDLLFIIRRARNN